MSIASSAPGLRSKIALSGVLIAASVAIAHLAPIPRPPYKMVDEVMAEPARWAGERLTVHGYIVAGTIVELTPSAHTFVITKQGKQLPIYYEGLVPDTVRDQSEVVLTGTLARDGDGWTFASNRMMAKCGGKYEGTVPARSSRFQ
ncbi:MAG: cytochrome c maturation protein CcmE [Myxococcales bacterium]|nr:cytochrome c maturation protein CcmE [Myxococcales bacterium]